MTLPELMWQEAAKSRVLADAWRKERERPENVIRCKDQHRPEH